MKKSFLMFGVAAMALASCTQNEVVEYAENRAIQFDTFVNNNTRAVTELKTEGLTQFNVFAYHGTTNTVDYKNVLVTGKSSSGWTPAANAYWQAGNAYEFAAYSDQNGELSNVSFANKTLTFTGYEVAGKDLVAAQTSVASKTDVNSYTAVNLTFYHMLSQIKFTFTNSDAADYNLAISNIKITAGKTATGTFAMSGGTPSISWTSTADGEYIIENIIDIAEGANRTTESKSLLILPQNTDNLNVTFTATLTDAGGIKIAEGNFEAPLDIDNSNSNSNWEPGYRYNYTATLNGSDVPVDPTDPDVKPIVITFGTITVNPWENSTPDTDPTTPVIPEP